MYQAHINMLSFAGVFSAPQKQTVVKIIPVDVDYSLVLPMALAYYLAVVGSDHSLEVSHFLVWHDAHMKAFDLLASVAFVAAAAAADTESVEVNNALFEETGIEIAGYGSAASL